MPSAPPFVTRFAPSPTGALHLGHAYSAVRAWRTARAVPGGRLILRIDDIDPGRSRREHVAAICADLDWLGIAIDGDPVFQSTRARLYSRALARLRANGLAYPCFCTRAEIAAEIAASAAAPHGAPDSRYPGTCRSIDAAVAGARCAEEPHCWRLDCARAVAVAGPLDWIDDQAGRVAADPADAGDIVLARKDAPASYHLASTIDDAALGITHVVRGDDLFAATHVQRLLQALLDLPVPRYAHHSLVVGADGHRLAKRDGAAQLSALRAAGVDGRALANDIARDLFPTGYSRATP